MEEKERYELTATDCILDTERDIVVSDVCDVVANADIITDLLNQQDKRIKELEKENQQLKQQLHDLPKKIVEEIKQQLFKHFKVKNIEEYEKLSLIDALFTADIVIEILDIILKKYGGEDE